MKTVSKLRNTVLGGKDGQRRSLGHGVGGSLSFTPPARKPLGFAWTLDQTPSGKQTTINIDITTIVTTNNTTNITTTTIFMPHILPPGLK
jgi:hypothetical protein